MGEHDQRYHLAQRSEAWQRRGSGVQQMLRQRCRRGEELGAAPQRACRLRRQGSRRAGAPCFPSSRTSCMRHLRRQRTRTVSVGAATGHSCRTGGRCRSKQNAAQCEQYRVRAPSPGPIPRPRSSQRPWRPLATWRARSAAARCPAADAGSPEVSHGHGLRHDMTSRAYSI